MARNITVQHLRGSQANIPVLADGELYFAEDTLQLWVGTSAGRNVLLNPTPVQPPLPNPSLPIPTLSLPGLG